MSTTTDVIGIYDENFKLLFDNSVPMQASVFKSSKPFTHPLEKGFEFTDHRIILPVEIELTMFLPSATFRQDYALFDAAFQGNKLFSVQTRTGVYTNMLMSDIPHEETSEQFDVVILIVKLQEAQIMTTQFQSLPASKVKDKRNSSTVKRGEQSPKKSSVLHRILY